MTEYSFSLLAAPDLGALNTEISELDIPGFSGTSYSLVDGDHEITVYYENPISVGEEASLDAAIAAHDPDDIVTDRTNRSVGLFDEFIGNQTGMALGWSVNVFGAGSSLETQNGGSKACGVVALKAASNVAASVSYSLSPNSLNFGSGALSCEWRIRLPNLATVTDDFDCFIGFGDKNGATEHEDGAYFFYDRATSLNWQVCTVNNLVKTTEVTNVPVVADRWLRLSIEGNRKGTKVKFLINGVVVKRITTNIPVDNDREFGPHAKIVKSAGVANCVIRADYFSLTQSLKEQA